MEPEDIYRPEVFFTRPDLWSDAMKEALSTTDSITVEYEDGTKIVIYPAKQK